MTTYLLRRLGLAVITLWLLSILVFFAGQVLPGDPGRAILGQLASPSSVRVLDHQLGVDRPLLTQYVSWIGGLLHGSLGTSYTFRTAVGPFIFAALVNSAKLGALAFIIVVPLGIIGGVFAALKFGQVPDRVISVTGSLLRDGARVRIGNRAHRDLRRRAEVVPGLGFGWSWRVSGGAALSPDPARDPARARAFRLHRPDGQGRTIESLESDYTRTATLKGLKRSVVIRRHVLRNSLLPTITVIATQTGYLIGGLVVVETLFNYQGIGKLIFTAAQNKDFPMLEAGVLTIGVVYMVATLDRGCALHAAQSAAAPRGR